MGPFSSMSTITFKQMCQNPDWTYYLPFLKLLMVNLGCPVHSDYGTVKGGGPTQKKTKPSPRFEIRFRFFRFFPRFYCKSS